MATMVANSTTADEDVDEDKAQKDTSAGEVTCVAEAA